MSMNPQALPNFDYTIKRFTVWLFGQPVSQIETEVINQRLETASSTVSTSHYAIHENHPLIPVYGRFRDDPTWDEYQRNIEEYRREIDALESSRG